jgi:hypothetical protein
MTPRLADLYEIEEETNLAVEVADGHIIPCNISGKIKLRMLDDEGKQTEAVLLNVLYVPSLNRRLFSIAKFVSYGHMATFKKKKIVLYFREDGFSISLPLNHGESLASEVITVDNSTTTMARKDGTPSKPPQDSLVAAAPRRPHTSVKKHISVELLHNRFAH